MKCTECGSPLFVASTRFVSEEGSTEVFQEHTMICLNSRIDPIKRTPVCSNYAGQDLNNPLKIVTVLRKKVG
jgi:hypothetical protein